MKKITITIAALLLAVIALASFVQATQQNKKPKATYQVGSSKVIVWENTKTDGTVWKNFQVEKVYKKGEEWATTNSFTETELLELKAAIDKAISEEAVIKK